MQSSPIQSSIMAKIDAFDQFASSYEVWHTGIFQQAVLQSSVDATFLSESLQEPIQNLSNLLRQCLLTPFETSVQGLYTKMTHLQLIITKNLTNAEVEASSIGAEIQKVKSYIQKASLGQATSSSKTKLESDKKDDSEKSSKKTASKPSPKEFPAFINKLMISKMINYSELSDNEMLREYALLLAPYSISLSLSLVSVINNNKCQQLGLEELQAVRYPKTGVKFINLYKIFLDQLKEVHIAILKLPNEKEQKEGFEWLTSSLQAKIPETFPKKLVLPPKYDNFISRLIDSPASKGNEEESLMQDFQTSEGVLKCAQAGDFESAIALFGKIVGESIRSQTLEGIVKLYLEIIFPKILAKRNFHHAFEIISYMPGLHRPALVIQMAVVIAEDYPELGSSLIQFIKEQFLVLKQDDKNKLVTDLEKMSTLGHIKTRFASLLQTWHALNVALPNIEDDTENKACTNLINFIKTGKVFNKSTETSKEDPQPA